MIWRYILIVLVNYENTSRYKWLVVPFDMKIDKKGHESDLEDELIEMHMDC